MIQKLTLFILLVLLSSDLDAQDPTFSQFYANRIYLNPAFAGAQEGIGITTSYKKHWPTVPKHFTTYSASVEVQEPCLATGLAFAGFYDSEGEGALATTAFSFVYAYTLNLMTSVKKKNALQGFNIHTGIKTSFVQKAIDWNKLAFSDQIDPIYGFVNPTNAIPIAENIIYPDFDFGIVMRQHWKHPIRNYRKTPIRTAFGFSVHHLLQPIQSFYNIETRVPRRYTLHAGAQIPFAPSKGRHSTHRNHKFTLIPNFKYDYQGEPSDTLQGITKMFNIGAYIQTPSPIYFGIFYQENEFQRIGVNTNAILVTGGVDFMLDGTQYTFGFSYDYNIAGLSTISGGAYELSLRIRFIDNNLICKTGLGKGNGNARRILDCNNFF